MYYVNITKQKQSKNLKHFWFWAVDHVILNLQWERLTSGGGVL